jgi:hypothetical protein
MFVPVLLMSIFFLLFFFFSEGPDVTERQPAKTSRRRLVETMHKYPNAVTHVGPPDVFGTSNYLLDVYFEDTDEIVAGILHVDSGGGWYTPQRVDRSHLEWIQDILPQRIPIGAFEHIPSDVDNWSSLLNPCVGYVGDGIAAVYTDAGMVSLLKEAGNVEWLSVGHDHGLNTCCELEDTMLHTCFGGHGGFGGCEWSPTFLASPSVISKIRLNNIFFVVCFVYRYIVSRRW